MDEVTPEMRLARRYAADVVAPRDCVLRDRYLAGRCDKSHAVQAALAAIKETSERAANWLPAAYFPTDYNHRQAQRAIRNLEHLK